jgi:hypothetical protein
MKGNHGGRKGLAVGVILVFIGVALEPSINLNVVKASTDDGLIDFTVEVCGLPGLHPQKVTLTTQQAGEVETLITDIKSRLDTATTREETQAIFKETIAELHAYGLLGGVTIEQAQRLMLERHQSIQVMGHEKARERTNYLNNTSNFFSLIAGQTTETRVFSIFETGCSALIYCVWVMYVLAQAFIDQPVLLGHVLSYLQAIYTAYHNVTTARSIGIGRILTFGKSYYSALPPLYHHNSAVGWINTLGVLGKKSWDGAFNGHILPIQPFAASYDTYYIGAIGFLGIKLIKSDGELFFLGSAAFITVDAVT